ncbi:hypothetical protein NQZ68_005637 [Dissostichus eleginoides]|nr:hypothetical protein NQZ68_005637 [Dissostichus eleginoides]
MKGDHEKLSISLMITLLCLGSLLTTALWIIVDNSSQLSSQCQGFDRAIITQANTPVGSNIVYAAENKKTLKVTPGIFSTFIKLEEAHVAAIIPSEGCKNQRATSKACLTMGKQTGVIGGKAAYETLPTPRAAAANSASTSTCLLSAPSLSTASSLGPL